MYKILSTEIHIDGFSKNRIIDRKLKFAGKNPCGKPFPDVLTTR